MDEIASTATLSKLTPKDFTADQEVRWCPGCGDYSILKAVRKVLAEVGASVDNTVFVSGIGCAARFPYYMSTYGFHTIHGRAPGFATGVKLANPDLDVWVVSGDGDALSIGGNHFIHLMRRNVDLQFLLFNNAIYGLTKGQYSPTTKPGARTPSSPMGSIETPLSACVLALGANGTFVARAIDTAQKHLPEVMKRARDHAGTSMVEILQNCHVFNDGYFSDFTAREVADDHQIVVEHGKPLVFGKERDRGLRIKQGKMELEVVLIGADGITEGDILVHDETNRELASLLASMESPDMPVAVGVLFCIEREPFGQQVLKQVSDREKEIPNATLDALFSQGATWTVTDDT
jgi:2-oxoglutarate/2-oxoacid ferredoxin oxidoreductase subunit beta